jgi:D-arabinose 1-dehydrogenase-like Zn-dependent alcohol dehydrogenase
MAVERFGDPLQRIELPEPEPGPGEALLEILTCGVCFSDVKTARGKMPFSDEVTLPHVPGHEICGRVLRSNSSGPSGPPGPEAGTVVVANHLSPCRRCSRCRAGIEQQCQDPQRWTGFRTPGGFQTRLTVPIDRLTPVPEQIDPVAAAPLTCAIGTAYRAVVNRGRVAAGEVAVVIGLGGVGVHALQVARAAGARVIGIDVSSSALEVASELGFDAFTPEGGAPDRARELSGGDRADVVVDTVGSDSSLAQAFDLVRTGGRVVGVGYSVSSRLSEVPVSRWVLEEVELLGSRYVALDELDRAVRLVADGAIRPVIDRVLPLTRANEALEALEAGEVVGRVVLDCATIE